MLITNVHELQRFKSKKNKVIPDMTNSKDGQQRAATTSTKIFKRKERQKRLSLINLFIQTNLLKIFALQAQYHPIVFIINYHFKVIVKGPGSLPVLLKDPSELTHLGPLCSLVKRGILSLKHPFPTRYPSALKGGCLSTFLRIKQSRKCTDNCIFPPSGEKFAGFSTTEEKRIVLIVP